MPRAAARRQRCPAAAAMPETPGWGWCCTRRRCRGMSRARAPRRPPAPRGRHPARLLVFSMLPPHHHPLAGTASCWVSQVHMHTAPRLCSDAHTALQCASTAGRTAPPPPPRPPLAATHAPSESIRSPRGMHAWGGPSRCLAGARTTLSLLRLEMYGAVDIRRPFSSGPGPPRQPLRSRAVIRAATAGALVALTAATLTWALWDEPVSRTPQRGLLHPRDAAAGSESASASGRTLEDAMRVVPETELDHPTYHVEQDIALLTRRNGCTNT